MQETTDPTLDDDTEPTFRWQKPTDWVTAQYVTRSQALRLLGEVLYAVRTSDGLIKIGWTQELHRRVNWFPGGVELLAIKKGERADEYVIHRALREYRARGHEYYQPTQPVLDLVNEWRIALGLDSLAV